MFWIWYTNNSSIYPFAPLTERGVYKLYTNNNDTNQTATFYYVISGTVQYIGINQKTLYEGRSGFSGSAGVSFPPGENLFQVNCRAIGGPAGFIGVCVDSKGTVLFNTDSSWAWMNNSAYGPMP